MSHAAEWRELIAAVECLPDDAVAALATLVRTRGSAFRRAGTRMLVHADGHVVCELSGGCPQRDIVERAGTVLREGRPLRVAYNAESGLDVLMEMGCGGELEVLVEPIERASAMTWLAPVAACLDERRPATLATWFARDEAIIAPRHGLVAGSWASAPACDTLQAALARPRPERPVTINVTNAGGRDDVLLEPLQPPHALVAIGGNTTAHALLRQADALGWQATLVDTDPHRLDVAGLPESVATCCVEPEHLRQRVGFDPYTSVVMVTHNFAHDAACLHALKNTPLAYVGAVSSRSRAADLEAELDAAEWVLHAPAGLDIGADTPEEIALATIAEILAVQRHRAGGQLYAGTGAIHT